MTKEKQIRKPTTIGKFVKHLIEEGQHCTYQEFLERTDLSELGAEMLFNDLRTVNPELLARLSECFNIPLDFWVGLYSKMLLWEAEGFLECDKDESFSYDFIRMQKCVNSGILKDVHGRGTFDWDDVFPLYTNNKEKLNE